MVYIGLKLMRIIFKILLLVHKFFIDCCATWFSKQLVVVNPDKRLLNILYFNSKYGRRSFSYAAPRYWNCLDINTRLLNDTEKFKTCLKTALFTNKNNIIQAAAGYAVD